MGSPMGQETRVGGAGRLRWVPPRTWQLWTRPAHVIVYILAVNALAAWLTATSLAGSTVSGRQQVYLLTLFCACVLYTEISRGIERIRREYKGTPHVELHSVWFFAATLLVPPGLVAVLVAVAALQRWTRVRHHVAHRRVFATAVTILAVHGGSATLALLDFDPAARTPANFGIVAVAAVVYYLVGFAPIALVVAMTSPQRTGQAVLGRGRDHALEAATMGLGLLLAWALLDWPPAGIVIAGITLVLHSTVLIRQLQDSARSDPKTGLLNATGFTEVAQRELNRASRHGREHTALLMLDIDNFKHINDHYGHPAGDHVIKAVASTITGEVRSYDLVGRWGGDELVILLPATTGAEAIHVAERIRARIQALAVHAPTRLGIERVSEFTASIGVAVYPTHGTTLDEIIQAADNACYDAKHAGRNRVTARHADPNSRTSSLLPKPGTD